MIYKGICVLVNLCLLLDFVYGDLKSSLVFVIDDTFSMNDEIEQVKDKTVEVFDAVLSSNASSIDDFVLVTFNDPDARLVINTRDSFQYKKAVGDIRVHGGADCEEYAMTGIELALENSKPNSFLYVFTDASAKDYAIYERVKSLSLKKSTQVTFLLTGNCRGTSGMDYQVFEKLSQATSGQVFNIQKHDVHKVIDYIIASIKHKKTTLGQKSFDNGSGKELTFTVDSKLWDVMISVSSVYPNFRVIGPDDTDVPTEKVLDTLNPSVVKIKAKPGIYKIASKSVGPTTVVVTASTTVTFQHGFSTFKPTTLSETSKKPISDQPSFLSIKLDNINRDVLLENVEIVDENDNFVQELPLHLVNEEQQLYTTESFIPPNFTFKIAVNGYTPSKELITRVASTTIEYQKPALEIIKNLPPTVTIIADAIMDVEYNQPLSLKCKVKGFPKPDIIWQNESGTIKNSTVSPIDLPYDYMSVVNIEKSDRNMTLTCKAVNTYGEDIKSVAIRLKSIFDVLTYPSDVTVEYKNSENMIVSINALPPATIVWYKDGEIISKNENFDISDDNHILTIKEMLPKLKGSYAVEMFNGVERKKFDFEVSISGIEVPKIDKSVNNYHVERGSSVDLLCRITNGLPKPIITWYIDYGYYGEFEEIPVTDDLLNNETYHIDNIQQQDVGVYRCTARNDFGEDVHDIDVFVEYPPIIETLDSHRTVKNGDLTQLPCTVYGIPTPSVRWLVNGVKINANHKYKIYRDKTLSFRSSFHDRGVYTCEASNHLGTTNHSIHLDVTIPIEIEIPARSNITLAVGNPLKLICHADGYPEPDIKWTFFSKDPEIAPKSIRHDETKSVVIERVQLEDEGLYTCVASNNQSETQNITYEIHVIAPPSIVNILPDKTITAVTGDFVIRIPCKVTGSPKPSITWKLESGLDIALGTEWYDIEKDGTLIIKKVDKNCTGTYVCKAENPSGVAWENYEVNVIDFPIADEPIDAIWLEEGSSRHIECGLPIKEIDLVRWFKNGRLIKIGDLYLTNLKKTDSGMYSCRVSNFKNSVSSHKNIMVGFKPVFRFLEKTNIEYDEGSMTALPCDALAEPLPTIKWWNNDHRIEEKSMAHFFTMESENIGQYVCEISNVFGTIKRTFNIVAKECVLNIGNDFSSYQPLLLSEELSWPTFKSAAGLLRIPVSNPVVLFCPNSSITMRDLDFGEYAAANCIDGSIFNIDGVNADFSQMRCGEKVRPSSRNTGKKCGRGNTELLNVGFETGYEFLGVYDVCIDKDNRIPLYSRHELSPFAADHDPKEAIDFVESADLPLQFDDMYNCRLQRDNILLLTGKRLSANSKCCFSRRQLVNPKDVIPGHHQMATYHYLNVLPKWGTCNTENWDEVENRVRGLVKSLNYPLEVWTGSSHTMKLPAQPTDVPVVLKDRFDMMQHVPRYIWKVILGKNSKDTIAIIQINIPDITTYQAFSFMLCKDICNRIDWIKNTEWRDVKKGFTFCCRIDDFEKAFNFKNYFRTPEFRSLHY